MSNDSSLGDSSSCMFDFDSQKGIMALLASVRTSALSSAQKNELRDLAFLYMNGGKDQSVRITLQQKVVGYNLQLIAPVAPVVAPVEPVVIVPEAPVFGFGTTRPAPSFSPAFRTVIVTPSEPVISAEPEVASPILPPVLPEEPAATLVLEESPNDTEPTYDAEAAAQRIRQIKSLVNERVGNPVNLVDINNDVGREYMASLLDAMKKLNSGASIASAMRRLEDAFVTVESTLQEYAANSQAAPIPTTPIASPSVTTTPPLAAATEPVITAEPETLPAVEPEVVIPEPATSIPVVEDIPIPTFPELRKPVPVPEPVTVLPEQVSHDSDPSYVVPQSTVSSLPTTSGYEQSQQTVETEVPVSESWSNDKQPAVAVMPIQRQESVVIPESTWGPAADTLPTIPVLKRATSLAESTEKLRTLHDLPQSSELKTSSVTGDSLFTKEVDDGLEQLLLEWPIFKKSGFFGKGPKGHEHPLFLKIGGLQISLLLAGRFEGATQEIRQSITDYMNGWRYEQGIIYKQGETFEHFLRRVIRHILDLQKKH